MPSPSSALSTLRPDLSASLEEFDLQADRGGFIGIQVLPVLEVGSASGTFGRIPIEQLLQTRDTERAPGSGYSRGKWKFEPDTFVTREQGAEEPIDDSERAMYREYVDAEIVSTARARDAVLRNQEIRAAALVFNATTYTAHTAAVTNEWDDAANATPITDVEAAVRAIYAASGLWPNALIINRLVFRNLRLCAQIIDAIRSTGAGNPTKASDVTVAMLSAVFDIPKILVAGGSKNTAVEGQAATPAQIWSNEYAFVGRVAMTQDPREPCVGRTFHWSEDGSQIGGTVESYRDETVRSDVIRCRHQVGEKTLHVEGGYLLSNITT